MRTLNHRVAILVPSTYRDKPAPTSVIRAWTDRAKAKMAEVFGGYTSYRAEGGWEDSSGLIEEPITVVQSYTDDAGMSGLDTIRAFAARMGEAMQQEAVSVEIDGTMDIVPSATLEFAV